MSCVSATLVLCVWYAGVIVVVHVLPCACPACAEFTVSVSEGTYLYLYLACPYVYVCMCAMPPGGRRTSGRRAPRDVAPCASLSSLSVSAARALSLD